MPATATPDAPVDFKDALHREWTDISAELYRTYIFPDGTSLRIENPLRLFVSDSGGHRVFSGNDGGKCFYVRPSWAAIEWKVRAGKPHFVK